MTKRKSAPVVTADFGVLKDLGPKDLLILRTTRTLTPEQYGPIVKALRETYNWRGVLLQLPPGFHLEHMNEREARGLYAKLKKTFQPKLLLPGDGRGF